ncbi:MAG: MBL fold metallo-hydrolase [Candidatus Woesearchaeota archaeon]
MSVTVIPLGGFQEIGRNCLALDIDGKILLIDFGFNLERFLEISKRKTNFFKHSTKSLLNSNVLPDILKLKQRKKDVIGIICSHAHLDHIGAIPYLANKFSCKIHATPFTASVIRKLSLEKTKKPLNIEVHDSNSHFNIAGINIDFIPVAHSTPDSVVIAIHTSAGIIMYANDFKIDETPIIGNKTNLNLFKKYSGKIKLLCLDCLYSAQKGHCESESTIKEELLNLNLKNHRAIFASTFSSHIARISTLCDLAEKLNRKVVFAGSSLTRYLSAAKDSNILDLTKNKLMLKFKKDISTFFRNIIDPENYFFIVTGHQGEENSTLLKLINGNFKFNKNDVVLFSNHIIPSEICIKNRKKLENNLNKFNVKMIKDIHVSGHLFAEDHNTICNILKPEYILPSHGDEQMMDTMRKNLISTGFKRSKILNLKVGSKFTL